jgi:hypothetical protein
MCSLIVAFSAVTAYLGAPGVSAQDTVDGPTLSEQLEATNAAFSQRMPEQMITNINHAVNEVTDTGILDQTIKLGDRAPDFELPDAVGNQVKLSSLLAQGPVILTWYRGNW